MANWFKNLCSCTKKPEVEESVEDENPHPSHSNEERGMPEVEGEGPHPHQNIDEERGKATVEDAGPHLPRHTAEEMVEDGGPHPPGHTAEEKGKATVEDAGPHLPRYTAGIKGKAEVDASDDPCIWSIGIAEHAYGEFSMAAAQANEEMEDQSQVEAGRNATAVGVYDGRNGIEASQYLCQHLFENIMIREAPKDLSITEVLSTAIKNTEKGFLKFVKSTFKNEPKIATTASCCVVGVIWNGSLYVANLGSSRAVLGFLSDNNKIEADKLSEDHIVSDPKIRAQLIESHSDYDRHIVVKGDDGVYRIKGKIEVSRAIGAAYLKDPKFQINEILQFRLDVPIKPGEPVVSDVPQITSRPIQETDRFVIFATAEFWKYLTNKEAVRCVRCYPREGIARILLQSALRVAMHRSKRGDYSLLKTIEKGEQRRGIHDDISVVVLFIDHSKIKESNSRGGNSFLAFRDTFPPSVFAIKP